MFSLRMLWYVTLQDLHYLSELPEPTRMMKQELNDHNKNLVHKKGKKKNNNIALAKIHTYLRLQIITNFRFPQNTICIIDVRNRKMSRWCCRIIIQL